MQLISQESERVLVAELRLAASFSSRLLGLQFRAPLRPNQGLLIVPCRGVHTCWMRFDLDLAMLDRDGLVLAVFRNVRPWRLRFAPRGTFAVLETAAGALRAIAGERVQISGALPSDLPTALRDWRRKSS